MTPGAGETWRFVPGYPGGNPVFVTVVGVCEGWVLFWHPYDREHDRNHARPRVERVETFTVRYRREGVAA